MIDLENINKTESYNIPERYFEEFPGRVIQRIEKDKIKRKTWILSGIAAVATLAIAATVFFTYNTNNDSQIIAEQTKEIAVSDEELLESLATEYYSEELAMMDFYSLDY